MAKVEIHIHPDSGSPSYGVIHELVVDGKRTHWVKQFMRDGTVQYKNRGVRDSGREWERLALETVQRGV